MSDPFEHLRGTQIFSYRGKWPVIAEDVFIAPTVFISGDVEIGSGVTLWPGVVIRGDVNHVRIGARTNLQDGTIVHVNRHTDPCIIGADVTVGHKALLHACVIEDGAFVGMSSTVMDEALVESGGMVAAGALVTPGKRVKSGEIWAGSPAKFMRAISDAEKAHAIETVEIYCSLGQEYREAMSGPPKRPDNQPRSRGFRQRP